jgi:hypothetical protein
MNTKAIFEFSHNQNVELDVKAYNEYDDEYSVFCEVVSVTDYDVDLRVFSSKNLSIEFEDFAPVIRVPLEDVTEITWARRD